MFGDFQGWIFLQNFSQFAVESFGAFQKVEIGIQRIFEVYQYNYQ